MFEARARARARPPVTAYLSRTGAEHTGLPGQGVGLMPVFCWQGGAVELKVRQHQEEQQRSYEEQRVLALEDRRSALQRVMTSPTGESRQDV